MPSTFLLHQRDAEASATSQTQPAPAHWTPAEIALVSVFSAIIVGVMVFCLYRFCPGLAWRQRRKVDSQQPPTEIKQTFLDLDDDQTLTEEHPPATEARQTFLHVDEDKFMSDKKPSAEREGLGIDMHPALRSSKGHSKRKHGSKRNESLDSTSSVTPLISKSGDLPASPPLTYSPRIYSPQTPPPPVAGTSTEVRTSPQRTRPLPTPVQPTKRSPNHPSRNDVSPLQTSATLPPRSQLPMSFLFQIDAKREDQTGGRSRTVSPLQNPPTPIPERLRPDSQLSSRTVSPISAPSTTPVITYPSATPIYLPRPFSKYNPYRPALEPATSKNWPLENMAIPEHAAVKSPVEISPVRKHLTQSPLKSQDTTTRSPTPMPTSNPAAELDKQAPFTHPELDAMFLEEFHRRRRQQQKAKEEEKKSKRKAEREKRKQQAAALRPAKKLPNSSKEKGIPPNWNLTPTSTAEARRDGVVRTKTVKRGNAGDGSVERRRTAFKLPARNKEEQEQEQERQRQGLPPRLPSKSRKPSQSPDAYEKARRISGLHELVGSSSLGSRA